MSVGPAGRRPSGTGDRLAVVLVGAGFAAAAVGNAVGTLPQARPFLQWCRDEAWLPPYRWVLERLVDVAPAVVVAVIAFQAALAVMLLARRRVDVALALALIWVVGLIPALAWPYWSVNVVLAVGLGFLQGRQRKQRRIAAHPPRTPRTGVRPPGTGVGVALGAGLGVSLGILLAGGPGIAPGIAVGAAVGLVLGAVWDARRPSGG
ncbi:hypothetical protein I4I73_08535 [Pseudonocardia sp. KRD-184]|uniref:Tryptophan-rich sensory protein n=2 Tax=Pseudonocardia oceani TaxID=2792013 RepID=A0ABS6UIF9_9PSEU|nr:hypothetical protein [Pseudonocardia oceani]MBW0092822.1 hypothetical protein [Pseudonocardia oceani]MBW0096036.1 hypothetical protein [Pseudonocardia oceani]MBW0122939.1 hypothetical protein [Pseudonocardia oceani]MBW0131698.1 hypothetical protein [Pseudonocardia oceani]